VAVCGGGAIGAACAYFLAREGAQVTLVERVGIASAASGKAGGFLARDWCDGTPLEALARRSFALHAELDAALSGDWGYRPMTTFSGASRHGGGAVRGEGPLAWLADDVALHDLLGGPETTAQVHPALFTEALAQAARAEGARLVYGEATGLVRGEGGAVAGLVVDGADIEAEAVALAMGPWSLRACAWLDLPAVHAVKGHSLVFDAPEVPAEAVFLEHRDASGDATTPEIFPRADGTVYACAISSHGPLAEDAAGVVPDVGAIERLEAICAAISPALSPRRIVARQACHRPVTRDGAPLIGAVPGSKGAFVATGHGVWGILNAPATGEAIAELILRGETTLDLSAFDPGRLPPDRRGPERERIAARRALGRFGATEARR
jgi:glycine/D-amino acid oxidase-like deaminating enzyme